MLDADGMHGTSRRALIRLADLGYAVARIKLKDLSPAIRGRVMAQYSDLCAQENVSLTLFVPSPASSSHDPRRADSKMVAGGKNDQIISPYANRLGEALDVRFVGRMKREYLPVQGRRFRIDFAFPVEKVAIEFDGYRYHGFSRKGFKQGLIRQNILVAHGWRVLRYTLTDVRDRLDGILLEIEAALHS